MQRRSFTHPTCAFSLIELSALLVVLALAMSSIISIKTSEVDRDTRVNSKSNIDRVYAALNAYAGRNGRLPCVASRTLAASDSNFGREVLVDCTADTSTPAGTLRYETVASSGIWVREGAVPVYDLLLPESMMFDEYGNRYSYAVIEKLTEASNYAAASGALVVKDAADADISTNAAFVVFSHGKDGKGAYRYGSGSLKVACGATANLDVENCDGDAIFRKADYAETQTAALYYDDLFRYGTKPVTSGGGGGGEPPPEPDFTGFRVDGENTNHYTGYGVYAGSDFNDDGYNDLLIGGLINVAGKGYTYMLFGSATGIETPLGLGTLNGTNGVKFTGMGSRTGVGVSGGDINGDGIADLVIGESYYGSFSGAVYVVFGKTSGWTASFDLSTLNGTTGFRMNGVSSWDEAGASVSVGNINGDAYDDIIIGAYGASSYTGYVYVVFGKASGWASNASLSTLNGTNGFRLDGTAANNYTGSSLDTGDFNGDGYDDLFIGSAADDRNGTDSGTVYLVYGKSGSWAASMSLSSLNGANGTYIIGTNGTYKNNIGQHVSAGDINGDGKTDILIGTRATETWDRAKLAVLWGTASSLGQDFILNNVTSGYGFWVAANNGVQTFATSAANGDINNDGLDDIVTGYSAAGYIMYVIFGKSSGWGSTEYVSTLADGTRGFGLTACATCDYAGNAVSLGDITGDGYADIVIGVGYADYGGTESGSTYGIYGKSSGWSPTHDLDTLTVP